LSAIRKPGRLGEISPALGHPCNDLYSNETITAEKKDPKAPPEPGLTEKELAKYDEVIHLRISRNARWYIDYILEGQRV